MDIETVLVRVPDPVAVCAIGRHAVFFHTS
jgi:hypothetical protein